MSGWCEWMVKLRITHHHTTLHYIISYHTTLQQATLPRQHTTSHYTTLHKITPHRTTCHHRKNAITCSVNWMEATVRDILTFTHNAPLNIHHHHLLLPPHLFHPLYLPHLPPLSHPVRASSTTECVMWNAAARHASSTALTARSSHCTNVLSTTSAGFLILPVIHSYNALPFNYSFFHSFSQSINQSLVSRSFNQSVSHSITQSVVQFFKCSFITSLTFSLI